MIVVTGGEGFIGKNLVEALYDRYNKTDPGIDQMETPIISLDTKSMDLDEIYSWFRTHGDSLKGVFHLGAISDTMETDKEKIHDYNVEISIFIWGVCSHFDIPLIYASSAATYGDGFNGFDDERDITFLQPLNLYGWSKHDVDSTVLYLYESKQYRPPFWAGLKFFNVYGYDESKKGRMASVVFQMYNQIKETGEVKLFKSHNPDYKHGEQLRDFIYVDDVVDVCIWMYENQPESGIYNVGTGKARTFNDLAAATFDALGKEENIVYIDTPIEIREKYQYYTEAKMEKLREAGYTKNFHELEDGVKKYCNKLKTVIK